MALPRQARGTLITADRLCLMLLPCLQVLATPQYTLTASMVVPQSGLAKGPFIGAQRGRAPPNIRGGALPQVRCLIFSLRVCIGLHALGAV